tara:strand:+ start:282 stop:1043 length:762 start_codon:yes stop_codon:yes gene_type:complete
MANRSVPGSLIDTTERLSGAETKAQILAVLDRKIREFGYDRYYLAHARRFNGGQGPGIATHTTFKPSFLDEIVRERMQDADLLTDNCWVSDRPMLWSTPTQRLKDESLGQTYRRTIRFMMDHRYFAGVTFATQHKRDAQSEQFWSLSLLQPAGFSAAQHDANFPQVWQDLSFLLNAVVARMDGRQFIREHFKLDAIDRECLIRVMDGLHVQQIADELMLADRTAAYHLAKMRRKLNARNNAHAVALALLMDLV